MSQDPEVECPKAQRSNVPRLVECLINEHGRNPDTLCRGCSCTRWWTAKLTWPNPARPNQAKPGRAEPLVAQPGPGIAWRSQPLAPSGPAWPGPAWPGPAWPWPSLAHPGPGLGPIQAQTGSIQPSLAQTATLAQPGPPWPLARRGPA